MSEGARCGTGTKPEILTKCPTDKFCTLAGGEFCIYGSDELAKMTQLAPSDLCKSADAATGRELVPIPVGAQRATEGHALAGAAPIAIAIALIAATVIGVARRRAP